MASRVDFVLVMVVMLLAMNCNCTSVGHMPSTKEEGRDFEEVMVARDLEWLRVLRLTAMVANGVVERWCLRRWLVVAAAWCWSLGESGV
ncbi:hypothetical protein LR48_Vigan11g069500 [Vigna angularis]|uniref:Secreted protein n=1 Tax=Phaseolus angularis TaxID=3914 RepID=A0A0L9VS17_PHAAN|nr:hypothetical protein LR48_Vigan11g069500 [Vigna angularis]